jgi:hypothetical protein
MFKQAYKFLLEDLQPDDNNIYSSRVAFRYYFY